MNEQWSYQMLIW